MPRDFVDCDCYNLDKSLLNENVRFHRKTQLTSTIPTTELLTEKCPPHPHTHLKATLVDGGCTRDVLVPF